jgi:hypothetical protein
MKPIYDRSQPGRDDKAVIAVRVSHRGSEFQAQELPHIVRDGEIAAHRRFAQTSRQTLTGAIVSAI